MPLPVFKLRKGLQKLQLFGSALSSRKAGPTKPEGLITTATYSAPADVEAFFTLCVR